MPAEYIYQVGQKISLFAVDRLKIVPKQLINKGQGQNEHIRKGL